jgi:ABC-type uncharacterized transport system involved in gliding motility auxiliary subunit
MGMNAYELADWMDDEQHWTVAIMLRQQADRIAELENAKRFIQNFAEEQHQRACELEQAQTKPLSDEEIEEIYSQTQGIKMTVNSPALINLLAFARAIEAKVRGQ